MVYSIVYGKNVQTQIFFNVFWLKQFLVNSCLVY